MSAEIDVYTEALEPGIGHLLNHPRFRAFAESNGYLPALEQQYVLEKHEINSSRFRQDLAAYRAKKEAWAKQSDDYHLLGLGDWQGKLFKEDVTNAYRRQARKVHPDKGGSHEQFLTLLDAYHRVLKTVPKRK